MRKCMVCLLLSTLLLTGCGNQAATAHSTADTTIQTETDYEYISLFCDVEFWHAPKWDITEGTITGDISRRIGAVINVMDTVGDPNRQLSLMLINDELPDIISVTSSTAKSQLVTSGKVWDLDEFLRTYKPDSHLLTDFPEDVKLELEKRDGGWYAYPSHMNSPDARTIWEPNDVAYEQMIEYGENKTIIWNKKILKELGLEVSELQEKSKVLDALRLAKEVRKMKNGETIIPLLIDGAMYQEHTLEFLNNTFGAEFIDQNGNYIDSILQPETKEAMAFLNTCMRYDYITPEQMTLQNDKIKELIASESVLCFIGNYANTNADPKAWVSSGVILSEEGKSPVHRQEISATTGWMNTFISKNCDHPEEIANFLDYMTSNEGLLKWVCGTEGEHYLSNTKGLIEMTEAGYAAQDNYSSTGVNAWWMFYNEAWGNSMFDPFTGENNQEEAKIRTAYAMNEHTKIQNGTPFMEISYLYTGNEEYEQIAQDVDEWKKTQIAKVILSQSEADFEQEYAILIQGLENRQIQKLNIKKNEAFQKNCQEYQIYIKKINE